MKRISPLAAVFALLLTFNAQLSTCFGQGTAFSYQGRLNTGGVPANGSYDMTFELFNANSNGVAIAGPVTNSGTTVSNGLFSTTIDFGPGVFIGGSNWLDIAVCTNGAGTFTELTPRQQLTPVPYAIFANTASNVSETIPLAQLPAAVITNNEMGVTITVSNLSVTATNTIAPLTVTPNLPGGPIGTLTGLNGPIPLRWPGAMPMWRTMAATACK